jgi:hypothetical protein
MRARCLVSTEIAVASVIIATVAPFLGFLLDVDAPWLATYRQSKAEYSSSKHVTT